MHLKTQQHGFGDVELYAGPYRNHGSHVANVAEHRDVRERLVNLLRAGARVPFHSTAGGDEGPHGRFRGSEVIQEIIVNRVALTSELDGGAAGGKLQIAVLMVVAQFSAKQPAADRVV